MGSRMGLYKFEWNLVRMGSICGLFIAEQKDVINSVGKKVHFGEVLGRHSEIYGILEYKDFLLITEDKLVLMILEEQCKGKTIVGYNPLDYISR